MKRSKALAGILFAAIFSLGVLVACGGGEEATPGAGSKPSSSGQSAAPSAPGGEPSADSGSVKMPPLPVPTSPGAELAVKIELPDFYPSDGPTYPDTPPSKAFVKGNKINLMFGTQDSTETVLDFMNSELPRLGWNNADVQRLGGAIAIQATKPGRELTVLLSPVDSGRPTETTLIAVVITD